MVEGKEDLTGVDNLSWSAGRLTLEPAAPRGHTNTDLDFVFIKMRIWIYINK